MGHNTAKQDRGTVVSRKTLHVANVKRTRCTLVGAGCGLRGIVVFQAKVKDPVIVGLPTWKFWVANDAYLLMDFESVPAACTSNADISPHAASRKGTQADAACPGAWLLL